MLHTASNSAVRVFLRYSVRTKQYPIAPAQRVTTCRQAKAARFPQAVPASYARYSSTYGPTSAPKQSKLLPSLLIASCVLGVAGYYFTKSSDKTPLNDRTFIPYTITSREAISPTSFIFTVSPCQPDTSPSYLLPLSQSWRWPLWSVEFKQPEVQIARHYTPLPPLPNEDVSTGSLRFYIRAVGDGEMSNYLSRLGVGRQVWLRGPHAGFDIMERLGARSEVIFLAGGTGVVPGLQAAKAVLGARDDTKVTLLWAVRKREELQAVARQPRSWWYFWQEDTPIELDMGIEQPSPIALQLQELKARFKDRLSIHVAVSEERVRFDEKTIHKALRGPLGQITAGSHPTGSGCRYHDQKLHEQASEFERSRGSCECSPSDDARPGKNLFIVCGPEGFVSNYAGPKVWSRGHERQGPVGGMAARLQKQSPVLERDWLVLKL